MKAGDDDWIAVVGNLGKVRNIWGKLLRILIWDMTDTKVLRRFYKTVSQAVLLFGAKIWVLTPWMEKALDSFQHRVTCRLIGRQMKKRGDGSWAYPTLEEEMGEADF